MSILVSKVNTAEKSDTLDGKYEKTEKRSRFLQETTTPHNEELSYNLSYKFG